MNDTNINYPLMKKLSIISIIMLLLLTGCEGEVNGLKYKDGFFEVYKESELRYISEVSQKNAINEEPLMTTDGVSIPFREAKLRLMKDIKIKGDWIPIKYGPNGSVKSLEGNHHTITYKNIKVELSPSMIDHSKQKCCINYGLFDKIDKCEIRDIKFDGDISISNKIIQELYDVNIGVLAGQLNSGIRLSGITNSVNISFIDYPTSRFSNAYLRLGGIGGIMDGGIPGIEFSSTIVNEGNLRAEGCRWTQIGGITASITPKVMFGQDVAFENKGQITANLSRSGDFVNNHIGGIFGNYEQEKRKSSKDGTASKMINSGDILVIANGAEIANGASDSFYVIGGICGWSEGLSKRVQNMKNYGTIDTIGNYFGRHPYIEDLIGREWEPLYEVVSTY